MKFIVLLFALSISLFSATSIKELKYESGISIYGQIGFVTLKFEENLEKKTYKMQAKTTSIGAVKVLSSNRIDTFTSEGKIENGVYKPLKFVRHTSKNDEQKTRTYIFDYTNKVVKKTQTIIEKETITTFHPCTVSFVQEEEEKTTTHYEDIEFQSNDFLSLYLNLKAGNLKRGKVPYVDMKEKDSLLYLKDNLFEVHKNHGEDKYSVLMIPDENSIFFTQVKSVGIAFYGDAYIKKISEETYTLN